MTNEEVIRNMTSEELANWLTLYTDKQNFIKMCEWLKKDCLFKTPILV